MRAKTFIKITAGMLITMGALLPNRALCQTGDFPFYRSFLDGNQSGITKLYVPANSVYSNSAILTNAGMQLTNQKSQVGAFYLEGYEFTPDVGIHIEFEYMMYSSQTGLTDGITMFLVENKPEYTGTNLTYGAHGAGFGYTHFWSKGMDYTTSPATDKSKFQISGIKGAYLAVALDNGPFKTIRMEPEEQRNGIAYGPVGYSGVSTVSMKPASDDTQSNVTIRGAAGRGSINVGGDDYYNGETREGFWGYPVLITRYTGARNASSYHLNVTSGEYDTHTGIDIATPFTVSSGGTFKSDDEANYRKAIIDLAPNKDGGGGFKITVAIQHGQEVSTVIKEYTYPTTVKYMENAAVRINGNDPYTAPTVYKYDLTVPVPQSLIMGFSGSTGDVTPYTNVIKNLRVTVLYGAQTEDDYYEHRRGPVTIRPLDNDFAYEDEAGIPQPGQDNVDPGSFRFKVTELENITGESRYECNSTDGKWVFDPVTSQAMFFPKRGFVGTTEILYDVKGKTDPYSEELYRSSLAKITVVIDDHQPGT